MVAIHDAVIREGGGETGTLQPGAIEAAIARMHWARSEDPSLAKRAALLLRGVAQDHPFVDGNKRTAYEAADIFLRQNGYELEVQEDELVEFMVSVAESHQRLPSITEWIREHMKKR